MELFATGIQAQITQKIVDGEAGPKYATSLTAQITQPSHFGGGDGFNGNIARMVQIQTRTLIHLNINEEIIFSVNYK